MTKEEILAYFQDINAAYNECGRYDDLKRMLDELTEERPKKGKWVGIEYDGYADGNPVYDVWECSNCHEEHEGDFDSLPNYCPECGAKMTEDKT